MIRVIAAVPWILNEFRASGVPATSMLMDIATYRTYQQHGTNHAPNGQRLKIAKTTPAPHLHDGELDLYKFLTSGAAPVLRVEQERIPLRVAESELHLRLDASRLRSRLPDSLHDTA